jgi:hypothetical protein
VEEQSIDGNHLVVMCSLSDGDNTVQTHSLIDCGATGFAFSDEDFARQHHLAYHLVPSRSLTEDPYHPEK